ASARYQVPSKGKLSVEIVNVQYEPLDKKPTADDAFLQENLIFKTSISQSRRNFFANVSFIPIIKEGSNFRKVTSIEYQVKFKPTTVASNPRGPNTFTSVLAEGDIYKIRVENDGMHKLTYDFLKSDLGIENLDNIDPRNIKIFGNGGGMLPEPNSVERYDDLEENNIFVQGENDGSFDSDDYILFYGEGPGEWVYSTDNNRYNYIKNVYSDAKFYFIKIDNSSGLRVATQPSIANTTYTTNAFDAYDHFEEEQRNLLFEFQGAQGSGKLWFGDIFSLVNERTYNNVFTFDNIITDEDAIIMGRFAGRSATNGNTFKVKIGNQEYTTNGIGKVNITNGESTYAKMTTLAATFQPPGNVIDATVTYSGSGNSEGWLDYLTMNARSELMMTGNQMSFRDARTLAHETSTFELTNAEAISIWDITDSEHPRVQETSGSNQKSFGTTTNTLKNFVAFNPSSNLLTPIASGKVENQNLHAMDNVDMVIVYAEGFEEQAERLREHRVAHSGLVVELARLDHIYNEFSGGATDVTAIRDFAKMIHERTDQFKYLLLFGDGTFDFKNIKELNFNEDEGIFHNLIPPYETNQSLNPISAYPSDDFFGLLSDGEGTPTLGGDLDIAVGRLPFKSVEEAAGVIDKIINYDTNPSTLGDWRIKLVFVGDDEDSSTHSKQADDVSSDVTEEHRVFNHDKILFDAFQQVSTPGGQRFPEATNAINQSMFKGNLVMNYLGHGGGSGWAQERVLRQQHIVDWENFDKLSLIVTATCSFTGYDEPNYVTAGELSLLNDKGGAIGLFTTVRAVFSSQNKQLTDAVFRNIFDRANGETYTIGDISILAKNELGDTQNKRKFALIGDPSQKLAIPEHRVVTTAINGVATNATSVDTLSALQKVTIEGQIEDYAGNLLTDFNGRVFPTIFDKPITVTTLGQDELSTVFDFELQKNIIFKGAASVNSGKFQFTFVVPKDINYAFGLGKISYYAHDGVATDAAGYYDQIVIGGTDNNALADDQPPLVEVFMNSEEFVFGGITDENPVLLVKLSDDNGINVVGNSIGHDLTGVLDENTQNTYVLNDFYESELDDYTKGTVRYPLFNLEEGKHQIRVRAWDVANNSAEGYTEFVVANSAEVALDHVLNYPNPFMENTSFEFEHNLPNQLVDVQIRVFSVSGRLVKTIDEQVLTEGTRVTGINWDGTDDFGDQLARGVYLYKVKIGGASSTGDAINAESDFEKLVILK
ncbi:MAG: type IX secretion system sortase PorU, partial [Bacteroidota bacterium]